MVADSHVTIIRPLEILPRFVYFWLASRCVQDNIDSLTTGTTNQQEFNLSSIRRIPIPVAPIAEQRRIITKVDELMLLIDKLESARASRETTRTALRDSALAALGNAKNTKDFQVAWARLSERLGELFTEPADIAPLRSLIHQLAIRGRLAPQQPADEPTEALIDRISAEQATSGTTRLEPVKPIEGPFTLPPKWRWVRWRDISLRIQYGYTASASSNKNGVRMLRITDIQNGRVAWDTVPGCQIEANDVAKYKLKEGDLLIARTGGTIGKSFIVTLKPDVQSVFRFLSHPNISRILCRRRLLRSIFKLSALLGTAIPTLQRDGTAKC